MINKIKIKRAYLLTLMVIWALLVFVSYKTAPNLALDQSLYFESSPDFINNFLLTAFLLVSFLYYKIKIHSDDELNINEAIWSSFITAGIMFIGVTITRQLLHWSDNVIIINFVYDINILFLSSYLAKLFYTFKRMILFQKTKSILKTWNIFEYFIYATLFFQLLGFPFEHFISVGILGAIALMSLYLSLNLKWIAYLTTKQKWTNLLVIFLILLISASFLQYIYYESSTLNDVKHYLVNDLSRVIFVNGIIIFLIFYSLSTILVMFFNVPTSSVFEKKANEVFNYQKLSHLIQVNKSELEIFNIVFETCYSTALAEAAWFEILHKDSSQNKFLKLNIEESEINELKELFRSNQFNHFTEEIVIKNSSKLISNKKLDQSRFKSILSIPISFNGKTLGILCVSKGIDNGFNQEVIDIIHSFTNQAGVSIENSRLMKKAIANERYQEEIKIAKQVQKRLLPSQLDNYSFFEVSSFSTSADEVGGDYFDIYSINQDEVAVVIGDVSGHGTSAAFNMAQLKGIFQGIIRMTNTPSEFLKYANAAVSNCLEKGTFITLTIYFLCNKTQTISLARAGHCPSLFYSIEKKEAQYFENKGLGLGILRNEDFEQHIHTFKKEYKSGDLLFIYTDGIVEAKNSKSGEYGFERLQLMINESGANNTKDVIKTVLDDLDSFTENVKIDDDYTCLAIKFS